MQFFNYVMRKVWLHQTRIGLSLYDVAGQGYLKESVSHIKLTLIPLPVSPTRSPTLLSGLQFSFILRPCAISVFAYNISTLLKQSVALNKYYNMKFKHVFVCLLNVFNVLTLSYMICQTQDLENYILELIPTLPQLDGLEKSFYSFYVCTAVRKFFFFLDPMRTGE